MRVATVGVTVSERILDQRPPPPHSNDDIRNCGPTPVAEVFLLRNHLLLQTLPTAMKKAPEMSLAHEQPSLRQQRSQSTSIL